jgi:ABC-2 type transport system permease protein
MPTTWTAAQTRAQLSAIAWLRWRIFVNSFRRKGGAGELVGRILIYCIFGSFLIGIVVLAGLGGYFIAHANHLSRLSWILWAIFILCQLLNIQLGQPGTTFDPTQLIRFPLGVKDYVLIRLFFGILTPANIVGTTMSLAVAIGIVVALPSLWLYTLIALAIFAAANVFFSRMIFAWVDRWLSTRRAREVFTAIIFIGSLGIQWANFTFNPAYNRHGSHPSSISPERLALGQHILHTVHPFLAALPPELISTAIVAAHRPAPAAYLAYTAACALFALAFLAVFALRMKTEYRGESLSDAANGVSRTSPKTLNKSTALKPKPTLAPTTLAPSAAPSNSFLSPIILAMLTKEFLYIRRTMGLLYGLVMPVFLVLVLAGRVASRSNAFWVFPAAVGYTLLAIGPLSYNSFGLDATGAQFYFLAPVRMRDILLAKNLFSFLLAVIEILAVFAIICKVATVPSLTTALAAILWAAGTLAFNTILGNRRSITTPKKINPQRMANKQASQVSAFISLGILSLSGSIAAGFFFLAIWLHHEWILIPLFALFAATGIAFYLRSLNAIDAFAQLHREDLLTELTKAA